MKTNERSQDDLRKDVSQAYEQALARSLADDAAEETCCAPTCCSTQSPQPNPAGNAAKLVDYEADAEGLPDEALGSSFGCGNPLAFSHVTEGQTVVDLGSGAGLDLLIASRKVGATGKVIGIDMTDAMLAEARRNVERAGVSNVELRKGLIEDLPIEDHSVDWMISNCVINLSPDKPTVFRELARTLRPGGRISISDIVVEELPESLRSHAAVRSACIGGAISEADYIAGLQDAGLVDVEVTERFVYGEDQLMSIVALDHTPQGEPSAGDLTKEEVEKAVQQAAGKVWSAKFAGRMPG